MNHFLSVPEVKHAIVTHLENESWSRDDQHHIITVMNGYGKRDGVVDEISGIIYRIWNAIKSLFNQSDWQLAKNSLKASIRTSCCGALEIFELMDTDGKIKSFCDNMLNEKSEVALDTYIQATYLQVKSSDEVGPRITEILIREDTKRTALRNQSLAQHNLSINLPAINLFG